MKISSRREPRGYGLFGVTWARSLGVTVTFGFGRRRVTLHWRDREMEQLLASAVPTAGSVDEALTASAWNRALRREPPAMTRLRLHSLDQYRQIAYVYGWRDVVAWPITKERIRREGIRIRGLNA